MKCQICGTRLRRTSVQQYANTGDEWYCPLCNETYSGTGQDTSYRESWLDDNADETPRERRSR